MTLGTYGPVGGPVAMGFALLVVLAAVLAHGGTRAEGKQKKPHLVLHLSSETSDKVVGGWGEDHLGSEMGLISRIGKNTFLQLVFSQMSRNN